MSVVVFLVIGLAASVGLQLRRDYAQALIQAEESTNAQVATLALALRGVANPERLGRVIQDSIFELPPGMALAVVGSRGEMIVSSTGERALQSALARMAREARSFSAPKVSYIGTLDNRQVLGAAAAIPGTDLVLAAGSPLAYVLSAWRRALPFYVMLLAGPAVIMLALAVLLAREMERGSVRLGRAATAKTAPTPARNANVHLGTSSDRTARLMSAVPIGISLWTASGELLEANDRFRAHIGISSGVLKLGDLERRAGFLPPGLADELAVAGLAKLGEGGTSLVRRGSMLLLLCRRRLAHGETLVATLDVTGLRTRSEAFARAEQDIAAERARAQSAEHEKNSLFASASHELRTPLNAILGFSEIMRDGVLGPLGHAKYIEYARDIHESGHRLLRLVDGILTMSEIERGDTALELAPIDPTAIARDCLIELREFAKDRRVELIGQLVLVPQVVADHDALRQTFLHLITNAVKRAAPGGRIEVGCESGSEDVRFTIKNIGPVSGEIDLKRSTMRSASTGNGLGLAIAKSLIDLQGGELFVGNEEDGSVSLGFTLPRQSAVSRRAAA